MKDHYKAINSVSWPEPHSNMQAMCLSVWSDKAKATNYFISRQKPTANQHETMARWPHCVTHTEVSAQRMS